MAIEVVRWLMSLVSLCVSHVLKLSGGDDGEGKGTSCPFVICGAHDVDKITVGWLTEVTCIHDGFAFPCNYHHDYHRQSHEVTLTTTQARPDQK